MVITIGHALPYVNARVLIPKDGTAVEMVKPVVLACFNLQGIAIAIETQIEVWVGIQIDIGSQLKKKALNGLRATANHSET
jgi:hypothetical protein